MKNDTLTKHRSSSSTHFPHRESSCCTMTAFITLLPNCIGLRPSTRAPAPTRRVPRPRTRIPTASASPLEVARKAKAEEHAAIARTAAESESIRSVLSESVNSFKDARYGICPSCDGPLAIPGLSHSLCGDCGWVKRSAKVSKEVELEGHHD